MFRYLVAPLEFQGQNVSSQDWSWGGHDVNGDGFDDLLIGNVVYYGRPWGVDTVPSQTLSAVDFRRSNYVGDINGDGFADAILIYHSKPPVVYLGSPAGLIEQNSMPLLPSNRGNFWGIGDINGDGFDDVVREEVNQDFVNGPRCGSLVFNKIHVYLGGPDGIGIDPDWSYESEHLEDCLGGWIDAGDLNGDGYSDMVVFAPHHRPDLNRFYYRRGKVYAFYGSADGFGATPDWEGTIDPGPDLDFAYGNRYISVADGNGDGFDDLLFYVGVMEKDGPRHWDYLYHGSPGGLGAIPTSYPLSSNSHYSIWVDDVDGDGTEDLLTKVAVHRDSEHLHLGPRATQPSLVIQHPHHCNLVGAGDLNGDGFADLVCLFVNYVRVFFGKPNPPPTADSQSVSLLQNTDIDITLTGSDPYDDPLTFRIEREPEHGRLEGFSETLGLVRYIPERDFVGSDSFEFAVLDPFGGMGVAEVLIEVGRENRAPIFVSPTPSTPVEIRASREFRLVVRAEDPDGDVVTYEAADLPWNANFDGETGVTYWTPTASQLGPRTWTFSATDGVDTVTRSVVIVVVEGSAEEPDEEPSQEPEPEPSDMGGEIEQPPISDGCGCTQTTGTPWFLTILGWLVFRRRCRLKASK